MWAFVTCSNRDTLHAPTEAQAAAVRETVEPSGRSSARATCDDAFTYARPQRADDEDDDVDSDDEDGDDENVEERKLRYAGYLDDMLRVRRRPRCFA